MIENPFVHFESDGVVLPKFPRTTQIQVLHVSPEAMKYLDELSRKVSVHKTRNARMSELLEAIGLHALDVQEPPFVVDDESGVTTEACRESGYEDGLRGNVQYFLSIFGKPNSPFHRAYMRGFFEGSFLRNGGK